MDSKRSGTTAFDTDYSAGSRKRRRTEIQQQQPSLPILPGGLKQSPIAPPTVGSSGLAAHLPSSLKPSPIAQNPQAGQRFDFSATSTHPGMASSLPGGLHASPIDEQQQRLSAAGLDREHHQRSDDSRQHLGFSGSAGLPSYQQQHRDLPGSLPLPPHANTMGGSGGSGLSAPSYQQHRLDPLLDPRDPVARMQLMQMQQQRDQYFHAHPEARTDENDNFLDAINAVLGPMPADFYDNHHQQQQDPFDHVDLSDPQHPNHPQHQLWLQQRIERETRRRREQEFAEEVERRRRQQPPE